MGAPGMPLGQWVPGYSFPSQGGHFSCLNSQDPEKAPPLVEMFIKNGLSLSLAGEKSSSMTWNEEMVVAQLPHRFPAPALLFLTVCVKDPG